MTATAKRRNRPNSGTAQSPGQPESALIIPDASGATFRRESRRRSSHEVPDIVGARIGGQALKIVDISRRGLLLQGQFRAGVDRALRIQVLMADESRAELTGKVARAFVASLSRDELVFGLGIRLDDLMPWLEFDDDGEVITKGEQDVEAAAAISSELELPAPMAAKRDEQWVEVDMETGLVAPKPIVTPDSDEWPAEAGDDSWASLGF